MGAVYGFLTPEPELPRTPNAWQTYEITLVGRTLTLVHEGKAVIEHKEIPGITGGALDTMRACLAPFTFRVNAAHQIHLVIELLLRAHGLFIPQGGHGMQPAGSKRRKVTSRTSKQSQSVRGQRQG